VDTVPSDVKAIVSLITLVVAIGFAYWERANGNPHLFWFVIALAVFAVVAMWIFPEAAMKKGDASKARAKE
jgi:membrane protein YdbS with pleckstrin-like domain